MAFKIESPFQNGPFLGSDLGLGKAINALLVDARKLALGMNALLARLDSHRATIASLRTQVNALVTLAAELKADNALNAALVNELKAKLNTHLTDGVHRADAAPNAGLALIATVDLVAAASPDAAAVDAPQAALGATYDLTALQLESADASATVAKPGA